MRTNTINRFALAEFFLVAVSFMAMSLNPSLGWLPLVFAALPWFVRLFWARLPFRKTYLDLPLMLFLLTAFVGVWAAYNQEIALHKFYLITGATLFFYALANQPEDNRWVIGLSLGFFGAVTTFFFLLVTDWGNYRADFGTLELAGRQFDAIQSLQGDAIELWRQFFQANMTGGINAILLPLCAAAGLHYQQQRKHPLTALSAALFAFLGIGLLLTSSRAAWGAVIVGLGVFAALKFRQTRAYLTRWPMIMTALLAFILVLGILLPPLLAEAFSTSGSPVTDVSSFASRIRIARDTTFLVADFPFTGGGLGAFPGLYSQYMLVIPHFIFRYSHNLYLDLALEQGVLGLMLWGGILLFAAASLKSAWTRSPGSGDAHLMSEAIYAGMVILLIHGIADDPIYAYPWGLLLLFALPGLALNLAPLDEDLLTISNGTLLKTGALLATLALVAAAIFFSPLQSAWQANLGATEMSRQELAAWPTGEWETAQDVQRYASTAENFERALELYPENRTANHRLGLILMGMQNFQDAAAHLERAYSLAPGHRGVKKSLGYCYAWLEEFEQARELLQEFPEARQEMEAYAWWWQAQGRDDLAQSAGTMIEALPVK